MNELLIIGIGHIGGSVAAAARARGLVERVHGVDPNPEHRRIAEETGLVDRACAGLDESKAGLEEGTTGKEAELLVVAVPPGATAEVCLRALRAYPDAIVTDCAGIKSPVVARVTNEAGSSDRERFVGGHPMAGTTGQGPSSADPELFMGRRVVLTPDAATSPAALETVERFWRALGAEVVHETPEAHDRIVAAVSHLPHAIAFALVAAAADLCGEAGIPSPTTAPPSEPRTSNPPSVAGWNRAERFAGPSFEGATRVAASATGMWVELLRANAPATREAIQAFRARLDELARALDPEGPADVPLLADLLETARRLKSGEAS